MKTNKLRSLLPWITFAVMLMSASGCNKSDDKTPSDNGLAVSLATDATLGQYLVDSHNQTLYFFSNDYNGNNSCGGQCADYWPYFYAGNLTQPMLGQGLKLSDFATITVNGTMQTTYKGWPLYYYAPDGANLEPTGQITGEAVANWFVAKPDYTIMLAQGQLVGADGKNYIDNYTEGAGMTLYFTDANGLTLYTFKPDSFNVNKYTLPDFSNDATWPIYDTTKVVVPSALDKSLFDVIDVHGKKQLTYKGWPLYYFGFDGNTRGNTKGVSVPSPGIWPVGQKDVDNAPQ